jgi:hypothetical protein
MPVITKFQLLKRCTCVVNLKQANCPLNRSSLDAENIRPFYLDRSRVSNDDISGKF